MTTCHVVTLPEKNALMACLRQAHDFSDKRACNRIKDEPFFIFQQHISLLNELSNRFGIRTVVFNAPLLPVDGQDGYVFPSLLANLST